MASHLQFLSNQSYRSFPRDRVNNSKQNDQDYQLKHDKIPRVTCKRKKYIFGQKHIFKLSYF